MSRTQLKPLTGSHAGFFNLIPGWPNGLRKSSVTYDVVRDRMPCAIAIIVKQRGQNACKNPAIEGEIPAIEGEKPLIELRKEELAIEYE